MVIALALLTSLAFSAESFTIDCQYKEEQIWQYFMWIEELAFSCNGTIIQLDGDQTVQSVTGNHTTGKTNSDVQILDMNNENLQYIPTGISNGIQPN